MTNPLLPLALAFFAATSLATSGPSTRTVRTSPALKAAGIHLGGGSECLWGCDDTSQCISNDRYQKYYPHAECRFSWMPYTCTTTGDPVLCNQILSPCVNSSYILDETKSSPCGKPVPTAPTQPDN